jgi:EAL domain-containing protein (putative c-di-GMP-specific phosphodiesterase class I)
MPVAEQYGLMQQVDKWVIANAIRPITPES